MNKKDKREIKTRIKNITTIKINIKINKIIIISVIKMAIMKLSSKKIVQKLIMNRNNSL